PSPKSPTGPRTPGGRRRRPRRARSARAECTGSRGRDLDLFENRPQRGVGRDALELELGRDGDPVPQYRGGQTLHVVGNHVVPFLEQREGAGGLEERDARARAGTERERRGAAG